MPTKDREYYVATTKSSRPDFTWFFFRPPTTTLPRKRKADSTTPDRVPSARRGKLSLGAEKPRQALMAPADVKAVGKTRQSPAKPKKSKSTNSGPKSAGPWSDWFVSEDQSHLWRARLLQNETWDYEFAPTTPTTSSSQLSQTLSSIPEQPEASTNPILSCDTTSPKISWPTIITASTGFTTGNLDASSSRTLGTIPQEVDNPNQANHYPAAIALVPFATVTRNDVPTGIPAIDHTDNDNDHTYLPYWGEAAAAAAMAGQDGYAEDTLAAAQTRNRATAALAKKFHAKVKSEKALKADPKRKVKKWLKGVELDLALIPLDVEGLPVY